MRTNKKKKGFTLIELIAVIAILGILALVIVPRISGYTTKASDVTKLSNAKTIVNAAELFNADQTGTDKIDGTTTIAVIKQKLMGIDASGAAVSGAKVYLNSWPNTTELPSPAASLADLTSYIASH